MDKCSYQTEKACPAVLDQHVLLRKWNTARQCAESTTVHHHDQWLAGIVRRHQAHIVRGRQLDVEVWTEPVSLIDVQQYITETAKLLEWGFRILVIKTVVILFSWCKHIPTDEVILINDVTIKFEKTVKFLGVIFNQGLTWAAYIDYIIDWCKVWLNLIRAIDRSTCQASRNILLIVYYKALIRSVIDNGCMAYYSTAAKTKEKLDRLQGQPLRICCRWIVT